MLDEFKDIDKRFYDATYPALASTDGILVIIGTPPKNKDNFYCELEDEIRKDKDWAFFHWGTSANPHISKEWLEKEKEKYYRRGEADIWQREFEAEYAFGGKDAIFPTWDREKLSKDFFYVQQTLLADINNFKLVVACDPGTTSTFAVLFFAYNEATGQVLILDEIYETEREKMTTTAIWYRILEKKNQIAPKRTFHHIYDEAGAWFANEVMGNFSQGLIPTKKARMDKERGLSIGRELMSRELLLVSNDCKNFMHEIENYYTDAEGKIPKKFDHLVDCTRYCFDFCNVKFTYDVEGKDLVARRSYTMQDDMVKDSTGKDFYNFLDDDLIHLC